MEIELRATVLPVSRIPFLTKKIVKTHVVKQGNPDFHPQSARHFMKKEGHF